MTIRSIQLDYHDRARLKELLREVEGQMSELSEEDLHFAEQEIQRKIRILAGRKSKVSRLTNFAWRRWGVGLSLAAASLFFLQPRSAEESSWQTKGINSVSSGNCEASLYAEDRSVIRDEGEGFQLPLDKAVYLRIHCLQDGFAHGLVQRPEQQPVVLASNQPVKAGYTFLSYQNKVIDLREFRGGELNVWVTDKPQNMEKNQSVSDMLHSSPNVSVHVLK